MISLGDVLNSLRGFLSIHDPSHLAGLYREPTLIVPRYSCPKLVELPICRYARSKTESRHVCSKLYSRLPIGENEVTCPFGVRLRYFKTDEAPTTLGVFLQTGFDASNAEGTAVASLPRLAKKSVKRGLASTPRFAVHPDCSRGLLSRPQRVLETLLAGRVAASIRILSHQLLTPVQGALSDVQQLKAGGRDAHDRLETNVRSIRDIASRIHILLSQNINPAQANLRKVVVHKIVETNCDRLKPQAREKRVDFRHDHNRYTRVVEAVPEQLAIVLSSILENAVKYSFKGFSGRDNHIEIKYYEDKECLAIEVRSYGCFITPDEIKDRRIFDLGYRGECSEDRGRTGTGSGLYIADRIVRAHSGHIRVESQLASSSPLGGTGAHNSFTVFWPKYAPEQ